MKIVKLLSTVILSVGVAGSALAANETMLMKCGASSGKAYFFNGEGWINDTIKDGQIILIGNAGGVEGEYDIRFTDAFGAKGYVSDGAAVFLAGSDRGKFSFIAAHSNYTAQYTFDVTRNEVLWTSHKTGTIVQKVGLYYAECEG
ncbi:hypothetical protein PH7735_00796 [Shimia thalassica]|uniref:Uncharacterized protein n=1 Tax=Shimia thalassica TaxID=1715693 RepID=A0A0P1IBV4_9RHOB|nr:hypothetical protein [Shimia thalassica]CUJ87647.1 hypothetical protein PH7735_00796 [Shimia thalassica]